MMMELDQEYSAEELRYSKPLDRHRVTHHPEVKTFLTDFQQAHFPDYGIKKRAMLDVLLMDLYVNYYYHPEMFIGFHRNERAYDKSPRYESLRITKLIIQVANDLVDAGFMFQKLGFQGERSGFITRIQALPPLEEIFKEASFDVLDIGNHEGRPTIILKDEDKNIIDYPETNRTKTMRQDLKAFNDLLQHTHVDLGNRHFNYIEREKGKNQKRVTRIPITQHNKFMYRVFNNSSWLEGGRYYGGWWQQISEEDRIHLRLNGKRTIEVDFSGIHIMLLYCRKNINYTGIDPYTIELEEIPDPKTRRWLIKQVLLTAVNAKDLPTACAAIRWSVTKTLPDQYELPDIKLTDKLLTSIIDKLRDLHPDIAEFFCTGAGIELQNEDSQIASIIMNRFTKAGSPVLPVHDSFICYEEDAPELREAMREAFQDVVQVAVAGGFTGDDVSIRNAYVGLDQGGYLDELVDPHEPDGGAEHQEMLAMKDKDLVAIPAHKARLRHFQQWLKKELG
jgi:hypothetical protein